MSEGMSREDRGRQASEQQRQASYAFASAWVEASAGTGKTKVLSDRVLRTLLSGVRPERILCLTYTKAAAVEMSSRISARLARFSVIGDQALDEELRRLLGSLPEDPEAYNKLMAQARRLFAVVLDTPSGLKIQTIHAFCQEVLKRFPLEARVSPYFEVMDERASLEALNEVKLRLIKKIETDPQSSTAEALGYLIKNAGETKLADIMFSITANRSKLSGLMSMALEPILAQIATRLGVVPNESAEQALAQLDAETDRSALKEVVTALMKGSKTDTKNAAIIARFIETADNYDDYVAVFLKKDGEIRKTLATQTALKAGAMVEAVLNQEAHRLKDFENKRKAIGLFASTRAVLVLAKDLIGGYTLYKKAYSKMDYEDLIVMTKELLENKQVAAWVLYKLDGGIDHVLIDEAQDTSPNQWQIVKYLTEEFFASDERVRTVFAVGDKKQSIYSFQGADPAEFGKMKEHFSEKDKRFREVVLDVSFRSTNAVLEVVNDLFMENQVAGVDLEKRHIPFRIGDAGKVELWPLVEPEEDDGNSVWLPPVERVVGESTSSRLAAQIATKIKKMVEGQEILQSQNRPIRYKDFLILVQRRNAFVEELVSALKLANVSVAGVDKIKLLEQIAVQDLLALGQFLLLPTDDLTLATLLKSPLFGLDDDDLFDICYSRGGASVWTKLGDQKRFADTYATLQELLNMADFARPFELFSYVLGKKGGRKKFVERMGLDVEDGLDEFMNLALAFEKEHIPSMQNFIDWMLSGSVEIKRELEQSDVDAVRIMTVHGSKGLQAPIVILPDTVRVPQMSRGAKMLWEKDGFFYYPLAAEGYNQNAQEIHEADQAKILEEYNRLLYVALTRAEDRLCLCGYKKKTAVSDNCWYEVVRRKLAQTAQETEGVLCYETEQKVEAKAKAVSQSKEMQLPNWGWIYEPAEKVMPLSKPLAASKLDEEEAQVPAVSPIGTKGKNLYRRGQVIHKLLQYLPKVEIGLRELQGLLQTLAPDLSDDQSQEIAQEVMKLLADERFAKIFGPRSKAEVPLMGLVNGQVVSGQIDRLVVDDQEVLIIDYKTNRPAAKEIKDVPKVYIKQMNAYKQLVGEIYPHKKVRALILWTDIASLMEI